MRLALKLPEVVPDQPMIERGAAHRWRPFSAAPFGTAVWLSTPPTVAENLAQSARKAVRLCFPASVME